MALYEHVFISRQDLTSLQTEDLIKQYSDILKDNGGKVIGHEYWGLRTLAYKINKNRKGHYSLIKSDSPPSAAQEMERLMKLNEDIMRVLTIKVQKHEDGPSIMMRTKSKTEEHSQEKAEPQELIN
jgi:small subunit ribosomal protein S6|tara:strand:- start:60 stop:437 length:378 start_codon:yes stop_codon:yes gene_type:complete